MGRAVVGCGEMVLDAPTIEAAAFGLGEEPQEALGLRLGEIELPPAVWTGR